MYGSANIRSSRPWVSWVIEARASAETRALKLVLVFGPVSAMSVFVMFSIVCIQRFELVADSQPETIDKARGRVRALPIVFQHNFIPATRPQTLPAYHRAF